MHEAAGRVHSLFIEMNAMKMDIFARVLQVTLYFTLNIQFLKTKECDKVTLLHSLNIIAFFENKDDYRENNHRDYCTVKYNSYLHNQSKISIFIAFFEINISMHEAAGRVHSLFIEMNAMKMDIFARVLQVTLFHTMSMQNSARIFLSRHVPESPFRCVERHRNFIILFIV